MSNNGLSRYQKQLKGNKSSNTTIQYGQVEKKATGTREKTDRTRERLEGDDIDNIFGFQRMKETIPDESGIEKSGMDLYFIERNSSSSSDGAGGNFKATILFAPYFYIDVSDPRRLMEISNNLLKRFEGCKVEIVEREDLDLPNHLSGKKHAFLKISFGTSAELLDAKSTLRPIIQQNQKRIASSEDYIGGETAITPTGFGAGVDIWDEGGGGMSSITTAAAAIDSRNNHSSSSSVAAVAAATLPSDPLDYLIELREYDVPYNVRVSIDLDLRVGAWYTITPDYGSEFCQVTQQKDLLELCEPRVLAFDIECEKSPLKFPNAEVDRIFMISYMVKNQGYLIINREIVSEDIEDFEYTPKPNFPGPFHIFNEANEETLLRKFINHIQELKPHVVVTYNGDKFDWPYVDIRCRKYSYLSLYKQLGIASTVQAPKNKDGSASSSAVTAVFSDNEYTGRCIVHLDAFCWVQRDSYLPQGNQGLKAVTKYKLGYDPVEVDPEDMLRFARERPHHMASYSVSDAVATYYLYTTYVHNFIFSLSTIIPMGGEDVLRKGSGTLCEVLLMVEAFKCNIVCPNKQIDPLESFHEGRLLESETYIGGHVECLEAGVFRADIPAKFTLVPSALQGLINNIDRDLTFTLEVEHGMQRSDALNYDEVRQAIVQKLEMLRDAPVREEAPIIYHLDVGAMYPNIILTNRLQPSAMVSTSDCAACVYNRAENACKRPMSWTWRGDFSPAGYSEYQSVRRQLTYERICSNITGGTNNHTNGNNSNVNTVKTFAELSEREQATMVRARLKAYAHRVYRKTKVTSIEERVNTVCMRENSFYVDTVKAFRDRRYDYKLLTKKWKGEIGKAEKVGDMIAKKAAEDMEVLMDSLQLAHKCILNSFYGYVMRKGARWRSMEMAGIVTHTGAQLIKQARELVEQVGRPLELDTDGIWCILPISFPQDFKIKMRSGSSVTVGYPCAMLNADVHENYTNHQYQVLQDAKQQQHGKGGSSIKYATHSECSIFFELDGPYKAMVLPASPEEGKLLKKKYVVFNFNGSIAELKGFELKRRGELELVKIFQSQVFEHFLAGNSLEECYEAVGAIANQWLDVLDEQGRSMDDSELLELISERKTISKTVDDYEGRKSTSLTTAARLADFLGAEMTKDKGLNCNLIISRLPIGAPVTERALPVAIFGCEPAIRKYFLRKWLKDSSLDCEDFRDVVDWEYYKARLGKTIQKIITIPAGLQKISNPCPRVEHPVWLQRSITERASGKRQLSIMSSISNMRISNTMPSATIAAPTLLNTTTNSATTSSSAGIATGMTRSILSYDSNKLSLDDTNKVKKRVRILVDGEDDYNVVEIGDLEDFGVDTACKSSNIVQITHYQSTSTHPPSTNNEEDISSTTAITTTAMITKDLEVIALNELTNGKHESIEQFNIWLEDRKSRWKAARDARKQLKQQNRYGNNNNSNSSSNNNNSAIVQTNKRSVGIADFVRNATLAATQGFWQVLELQETDTPGEFVVWAMTSSTQLQQLTMIIPRYLFVNVFQAGREAQLAAQGLGGVRIKKDLPHGKLCRDLYEVQIPERKFIRNARALNLFLCDTQIEGVYESQVPLWLRGVLHMGCVANVNQHNPTYTTTTSANSNSKYFKLQDLNLVHISAHPYLTPHTAQYRRVYIYFSCDKTRSSGDLGIIGLFQIESNNLEQMEAQAQNLKDSITSLDVTASDSTQYDAVSAMLSSSIKAYIWLVNGKAGALESKPPLQRIYNKFKPTTTLNASSSTSNSTNDSNIKFIQTFVPTVSAAWQLCNERLTQYGRERHGPTVIILQGGHTSSDSNNSNTLPKGNTKTTNSTSVSGGMTNRQWRYVLPALHDFPIAVMPAHSLDCLFPAVGWQMFAAERMMQRFLIFPRWFDDRLACARYAHVPVCNLGSDALTTMIDVMFSRQLQHNRHLLWASEASNVPDIGKGADSGQELLDIWNENLKEPIINTPGVYRGVCIELDLYGLAVCAIMSSGELDAEGLTSLAMSTSASAATSAANNGFAYHSANTCNDSDDDDEEEGAGKKLKKKLAEEDLEAMAVNVVFTEHTENTSDASCARAFNIFKALIAKCIDEVGSRSNASGIADSILTAVYRYLCGYGNGLLSDPLLHRVIYGLMTKLFQKLISGLKKLGTRVVYADFGRIIISTNKHDYASAQEYMDFILAAVGNKNTFAYLQVNVKSYWEQMCWLGPENWGGISLDYSINTNPTLPQDVPNMDVIENVDTNNNTILNQNMEQIDDESDIETPFISTSTPIKSMKTFNKSPIKYTYNENNYDSNNSDKEENELDFLNDIHSSSSNSNLANIKNKYLHNSSPSTGKKSHRIATNKSYKSSYARDPHHYSNHKPHHAHNNSEDDDNLYDTEDYHEYDDNEYASEYEEGYHHNEEEDDINNRNQSATGDLYPEQQQNLVQTHWNLASYLPEAAAEYFYFIINEFLIQYKTKKEQLIGLKQKHQLAEEQYSNYPNSTTTTSTELNPNSLLDLILLDENSIEEAVKTYMKQLIQQRLTTKMLEIVDELQRLSSSYGSTEAAQYRLFPKRAGSHLNLVSPALEFVKATTKIMGLDTDLALEVSALRRLLLTQLKVREFSEDSIFRDPCLSYVLRDVICSFCSTCRDLDLLRDETLTCDDSIKRWRCKHCNHRIHTDEVENRLLDAVEKLSVVYLLQDLKCITTHRVSRRLCTSVSDVSLPLVMEITRSQAMEQLYVLKQVAIFHKFNYLLHEVTELMI